MLLLGGPWQPRQPCNNAKQQAVPCATSTGPRAACREGACGGCSAAASPGTQCMHAACTLKQLAYVNFATARASQICQRTSPSIPAETIKSSQQRNQGPATARDQRTSCLYCTHHSHTFWYLNPGTPRQGPSGQPHNTNQIVLLSLLCCLFRHSTQAKPTQGSKPHWRVAAQ